MMNTITCQECQQNPTFILMHTSRCFTCITGLKNPNKIQDEFKTLYHGTAYNFKLASNCTRCKEPKVMNFKPCYKKTFPNTDKNKLISNYGNLLCCECVIQLANDENLFID